jgi:hypothetical protein
MLFAYIDETGNSGGKKSEDQPIHLLGSLVIDSCEVRFVEDAMDEIAAGYSEDGSSVEFKGADLYGGHGSFKKTKPADRIVTTEKLIDLAVEHARAFGYAGVDKRKSFASDHPQVISITFLLERLQPYLRAHKEHALIVADEYNELGDSLIEQYERFKKTGTSWGYAKVKLANVVDSLHYVKSKHSRLLQLCDVLTHVTIKWLLAKERLDAEIADDAVVGRERQERRRQHATRPELASIDLWERLDKLRFFRAKIFP